MAWSNSLGDHNRGSRPRCVLLVDGEKEEVAARLTRLVGVDGVEVASSDVWRPYGKPLQGGNGSWDAAPAEDAELDKATDLLPKPMRKQLADWWLAAAENSPRTPNWDIASTCSIRGKKGLLLVEAKAHWNEVKGSSAGKQMRAQAPEDSVRNHERIGQAIEEAAAGLQAASGGNWDIGRDRHYQMSNRFAWAWKLASMGTPVVLVYLGFLYATDIAKGGNLFHSEAHWERVITSHSEGVVDSSCWGRWLDVSGVPLLPLIRALNQPFRYNGV